MPEQLGAPYPGPAGRVLGRHGARERTLVLAALSTGTIADVVSHRVIKLDARMPNLNPVTVRNYVVDVAGAARPVDLSVPPRVGAYGYE